MHMSTRALLRQHQHVCYLSRCHSLMMLSEAISIGRIMSLSWVPHVLRVRLLIWVLLDGPVGISSEQESVQGAGLALALSLGHVLGWQHRIVCHVVGALHHRCEWLQVRSVVPSVIVHLAFL